MHESSIMDGSEKVNTYVVSLSDFTTLNWFPKSLNIN